MAQYEPRGGGTEGKQGETMRKIEREKERRSRGEGRRKETEWKREGGRAREALMRSGMM
jgi:hypothetical protein